VRGSAPVVRVLLALPVLLAVLVLDPIFALLKMNTVGPLPWVRQPVIVMSLAPVRD